MCTVGLPELDGARIGRKQFEQKSARELWRRFRTPLSIGLRAALVRNGTTFPTHGFPLAQLKPNMAVFGRNELADCVQLAEILDYLNALRVFEAVARLGSVRSAAAELSVTDGAVSKQLRGLEAALDVELFIRGHRRMILTEDAARLSATLGDAFEAIVRATEHLQHSSRSGTINIAAPSTFLIRWLLPRLSSLEERIRGTQINLVTWNKDLAASDRSIDIHVIVGKDTDLPGMTREILGPETFGPVVCAAKTPAEASDILKMRRLGTSWPTAMWRNWSAETGYDLPNDSVLRFERLLFAIEAAEAGLGVALAPGPAVWDALASGRLTAPLGLHQRDGQWNLIWRTDQTSGLHMSILRWFQREFEASQAAATVA
ncbi:LysR substrate-binding domain-containing protein [Loktanella sp. IMCC34160]|uniref:LysR substrate-binding domain-containing protein n=1 Tax=Loktanella sp. IMCC34160 TaxID=2510646 RepID=UPI0013ECBE7A|nr:LysR substrate-binding domain-containing protein [Loktanella sp. IMCC34160]